MNTQDYLLIIDGSSLLSTQFFGNLPREILFARTPEEKAKYFHKIMMTRTGVYTNAVFGFLRTLFKILKEQKPKYLAVTWDLTRDTFRRERYPEYKANRDETMKPLSDQFALCQDVLRRMGVREFMDERYEADDYSGSLAKRFEAEVPVRILTKDHDYLQLVTDRTHLWLMMSSEEKVQEFRKKHGVQEDDAPEKAVALDPELVEKEFLVKPASIPALKGLMGDTSDNIPGVAGVGPKTAAALIAKYLTVDRLYEAIRGMTPEQEEAIKKEWKTELGITRSPLNNLLKTSETELSGEAAAKLSEELATIVKDLDLSDTSLDDLKVRIDANETAKILDELEIRSIQADFFADEPKEPLVKNVRFTADLNETQSAFRSFESENRIGASYVPGSGLAVATGKGDGWFFKEELFLTSDVLRDLVRDLSKKTPVSVFGGKAFYRFSGVVADDAGLQAYLIDPVFGNYDVKTLSDKYLNGRYTPDNDENRPVYEASAALALSFVFLPELSKKGLLTLYEEIEKPTMAALSDLETTGIMVERSEFTKLSESLKKEIHMLEEEIFGLAGERFNINSPKQLGELLFDKLKLPYGKKTKTGYSTNAEILEKLKGESLIVSKVLEYRAYSKLLSTYAVGLLDYIRPDGRIYGKFHQTVTATGRISSSDPNLQNIPVRTELGRRIRKLFVPKPGCVFIDADYSQIELRILAHLSGDQTLIGAYQKSVDIHALTASEVFHVPLEEVTPEERRSAKAVNFGIVYGISAYSLSEDLGISRKEAEEYMNRYFETYPDVKSYLDRSVREAVENGYSRTMYGRIRPIPELASSNFNQRSFGERVAMNAPIQGTAADVMKIAVIRVNRALKEEKLRAKMVLQVHDEILIEAPEEEADRVGKLLVREMEGAADLKVPLKVEVKRGRSWYETK